ncbi:MAG: SCP2 sterol-binding domain-containing protein [Acidobacteriota bacterium]|nr:SCP2 sterol-binding domain-containing protein [Acidobacteriota bacterium]
MKSRVICTGLAAAGLVLGTTAIAQEPPTPETAAPETTMEDSSKHETPVLMTAEWAVEACDAWNGTEELTTGLVKWMENDKDRGFKVIQLYRLDCEDSPRIELRLEEQEGEVKCAYGGAVETEVLERSADYVMTATTDRWLEMGAGDYGPMKGMMTGRLKFKGPKFEAMRNMGPFKGFLLLVGQVPGDPALCPAA